MRIHLSPDNLSLLLWISEHAIVTTHQVITDFYGLDYEAMDKEDRHKVYRRVSRRLLDLTGTKKTAERPAKHHYLTRIVASSKGDGLVRPPSCWFLRNVNYNAILRDANFEDARKVPLLEQLEARSQSDVPKKFSSNEARHEILLTRIHLALERQCRDSGEELLFFYRVTKGHFFTDTIYDMVPYRSKLTGSLMDREESYPVVVDAVACLVGKNGNRTLAFFEADNRTENVEKISKKVRGLELYRDQNRFHLPRPLKLLDGEGRMLSHAQWLNERFQITDPEYVSRLQYRVFVVAKDELARNKFFYTTSELPEGYFYFFASIEDFERDPFGAIYLCRGNFEISEGQKTAISRAKGVARSNLIHQVIAPMQRQAYPFGRSRSD